MQPFLNGLLIGSVVWSIFVAYQLREAEARLTTLERSTLHFGDAATIRVVQGDTVTFGRWSEPVKNEEGAK